MDNGYQNKQTKKTSSILLLTKMGKFKVEHTAIQGGEFYGKKWGSLRWLKATWNGKDRGSGMWRKVFKVCQNREERKRREQKGAWAGDKLSAFLLAVLLQQTPRELPQTHAVRPAASVPIWSISCWGRSRGAFSLLKQIEQSGEWILFQKIIIIKIKCKNVNCIC